jgi:hypothetical protein
MQLPTLRLELASSEGLVKVVEAGATRELRFATGSVAVARRFRSDPPSESDLESAIEVVEEAVMSLVRKLPSGASLVCGDALTDEVAALSAGDRLVTEVSIDAVETLFDQLARAAQRGSWAGTTRVDATLAAAVLILREFMHHGGFKSIRRECGVSSQDTGG